MVEDEDEDEDFGDLYADVEVEARSAINNAAELKSVIDEKNRGAIHDVENGEHNDDDDDDDLDIVLNSDDDSVGRHGEAFTVARNCLKLGNRVLDDEEDQNWGTVGVKSSLLRNSHSIYKYLRCQSATYGSDLKGSGCVAAYLSREDHGYCQRTGARSMGPQSGQRFSLPWSRNILDVNIDIFEQKPWKHTGADITDYFNFGFNEDSWKLYCTQVDEYRHRGPMSRETPLVEPAHLMERKGRAIQVEDSIVERQSSMDVRGPLDRDSDVIQITILDPGEHLDSCVLEAPKVGDVSGDDVMDHLSFSTASEDESVEGDQVEMDIYAPKRIRSSSSNPVGRGSESHESHLMSDCSGRTDEVIRNSNNTKESMLIAESSDAEKSHVNHCTREPDEIRYYPMHTSPVYNNRSHRDSKHKHLDVNNESHSRNLFDHRYRSRSNSPVYNNRTHQYYKPNPSHENEIRKPLEYRYYARQSKGHHEYDDSFSMSDIEGTYDVHSTFGCNRQNERLRACDPYNEGGKSYLKSELPSDYYGERFSGYEDWDSLARDHHHRGYERYEAKTDRSDFRSSEEECYGDRRRYIEDNRMMEGDWGVNERELSVENVDFGWTDSKYPPYLKYKRDAQWKRKGDGMQFRNYGEDDEFCREREFSDDILGEKYATLSYNDRERDGIAHGYIKHVEYTKWEFRGPRRNERRVSSPSSELNNPLLKKDEDRVLRYREDYSFASRSSEESHIICGRWQGNMMPKNSLDGRHTRNKDQWSGYDGSLGDYSEPFDREDYKLYTEGRVNMGRKRHWQSEMQWEEDEVMLRHEDAKFCVDRTSLPFKNVSRHKRFVFEPEPNHVEVSIDDPHVERRKLKLRRKGTSSDKYERNSDITRGGSHAWSFLGGVDIPNSCVADGYDHVEELTDDSHAKGRIRYNHTKKVFLGNKCSETFRESRERISLSCKNSLHSNLVVGEVKSSEKQKQEWMDFNSCQSDRVAQAVKTNARDEGLDIEDGQVLTEEITVVPLKVETKALENDVNKLLNKNGKTGVNNPRILEAMAKMEKRRARFNEPISTTKKDSDSTGKVTVMDSVQETASNKQQRPARKRRWGGS